MISGCNMHCYMDIMLDLDFVSLNVIYTHVCDKASFINSHLN